ncbi:RteC domain-containing protein, partial [Chryseobacterium sp. ISL-6]|uniref:RteC domain-containing protein n=1 Tax=Chryseobacterium sp. ISL-6 TaxID=2819143 RepID=UPI001BE68DF7
MLTKTFFRKISKLREGLDVQILVITKEQKGTILSSELILLKIDSVIRDLKKILKEFTFETIADEVHFFKDHKPYFISRYIYYSRILHIETSKPVCLQNK